MSPVARLCGWTPFRLHLRDDAFYVDWCHLGPRRMVEPFHYQTVAEAMREPFNLAFQQTTPVSALAALPPGLPVAGLVFHLSRCGSTLVAQALAACESNIVVAEATPLRTVLRAHALGRLEDTEAVAALRGLVGAYAQRRFASEARVFVKFMAGDLLDIGLIRRAFPDVPWIVVTRDPAEILASQARSAGLDLVRGQIPAARLGLTEEAMWRMDVAAFRAHVVAGLARAGLAALAGGGGLVVDHGELPEALWTRLPAHVGFGAEAGAAALMQGVARRHSKRPDEAFDPAHDPNRAGADAFRSIAEAIAGRETAALAAARRA